MKKVFGMKILMVLGFIVGGISVQANGNSQQRISAQVASKITEKLQALQKEAKVPGLAVSTFDSNGIQWQRYLPSYR